jgi:pectinesterase
MSATHLFLVAVLLLSALASDATAQTAPTKIRIALAGDSTVTDDAGWGLGFAKAAGDKCEVLNFARGGRSSKSFRDEGHWQSVLDSKPAYVLIQFGHNDQPGKGPERETDAATTFRENIKRYVDEVRAIGAQPVLITSIARRHWTDETTIKPDLLANYADATRAVASEQGVPLIDLYTRSIDMYESMGKTTCALISPKDKDGKVDGTHLNVVGSEVFGPLVAYELRVAVPQLRGQMRGYITPEQKLSTTQPTTAPTTDEEQAYISRKAGAATPQGAKTITVASDGSGDVRTVQEAIRLVPDDNADRTTLRIRAGTYKGPIVVPASKQNVSFVGDGADKTVLTYALNVNFPSPPGVPNRMPGTGVIILADGWRAKDITFQNTSGDHGQAMALRTQGDRAVIENCRLLGWQDTLLVHSNRQYFKDCYIEGRVDFIYGASTAVFERCEIKSKQGGYITAASTPQENEYGYVFLDCKLTSDESMTPTYLGRPWRPYAMVAFIRCEMGPHIRPEGWHNWRNPENEKMARYYESACTGPGADRSGRVPWSREMDASLANTLTAKSVLAGTDGWDPTAP